MAAAAASCGGGGRSRATILREIDDMRYRLRVSADEGIGILLWLHDPMSEDDAQSILESKAGNWLQQYMDQHPSFDFDRDISPTSPPVFLMEGPYGAGIIPGDEVDSLEDALSSARTGDVWYNIHTRIEEPGNAVGSSEVYYEVQRASWTIVAQKEEDAPQDAQQSIDEDAITRGFMFEETLYGKISEIGDGLVDDEKYIFAQNFESWQQLTQIRVRRRALEMKLEKLENLLKEGRMQLMTVGSNVTEIDARVPMDIPPPDAFRTVSAFLDSHIRDVEGAIVIVWLGSTFVPVAASTDFNEFRSSLFQQPKGGIPIVQIILRERAEEAVPPPRKRSRDDVQQGQFRYMIGKSVHAANVLAVYELKSGGLLVADYNTQDPYCGHVYSSDVEALSKLQDQMGTACPMCKNKIEVE